MKHKHHCIRRWVYNNEPDVAPSLKRIRIWEHLYVSKKKLTQKRHVKTEEYLVIFRYKSSKRDSKTGKISLFSTGNIFGISF